MLNKDKKIFILDTNVLISDPYSIFAFEDNDIVIPTIVLEELDNIKDRKTKNDASQDARTAIRNLNSILENSTAEDIMSGVKIGENLGILRIYDEDLEEEMKKDKITLLKEERDHKYNCDNIIINSALKLQNKYEGCYVCLVTKDINMSIKAKVAGLKNVSNYKKEQAVDDLEILPSGYIYIDDILDKLDSNFEVSENGRMGEISNVAIKEIVDDLYLNLFLIDKKNDLVLKVKEIIKEKTLVKIYSYRDLMKNKSFGLDVKSIEQGLLVDVLKDDEISLVTILGQAGTGKTLLTIATAIEEVLEKEKYEKIIIARSLKSIDDEIGFLPGTEQEKVEPWMGAFTDNIEYLCKYEGNESDSKKIKNPDDFTLNYIYQKANIQMKSIGFMRGRSFNDTLVIIDEAQSLTKFQLKTIISRIGQNSKIVCMGNLSQIDSNYITALTSGLTHVVNKSKMFEKAATVTLASIERSDISKFAENEL